MGADSVPGVLSAACAEVRVAGPADAVDGVLPRYVASPGGLDEASAVLRAAAADGLATVARGAGTRLSWGSPPTRCDLVIDTRRMNRVLEHAAGDLVVRVQAGAGLDQLAAVLSAADQRLALDPPPASRAAGDTGGPGNGSGAGNGSGTGTVGGILATGAAGPLRFRYGTPRDLLIGITVVRADGTVASSGGKVVKNVAGYDLGKLFTGSYGTLGLIAEAAFRLHPRPGATSFVTADCPDAASAHAAIAAAAESPLTPSAAEIDRPARTGPVRVGILLEGDPDGVAERATRMTKLLDSGPAAAVSPEPPGWWGRGAAAAADGTVLRIGFWAAGLARVIGAVDAAASAVGLDPAVSGSAAAGVIYAAVGEDAEPAAVSEFVGTLRAALADDPRVNAPPTGAAAPISGAGGTYAPAEGPAAAVGPVARATVVVQRAPAAVRATVDLWGPVPALGLMRAVKDQFDPGHLMAPGRFVGGI
jgi:glycolate oxidase FAD binding subunit